MKPAAKKYLQAMVFVGLSITLVACNQEFSKKDTGATLEGTVFYGDEQVMYALVIVQTNADSVTGKINEDGKYKITSVPLGEVNIAVNTDAGKGDFMSKTMQASQPNKTGNAPGKVNLKYTTVPKEYQDPTTSKLKTTIVKGVNPFDIKISKK
jgi:hypothetical protein